MVEIGTFTVTSGKLVVSDPCYTLGTWCMGHLDKVRNGKWKASVIHSDEASWGNRIAEVTAWIGRKPGHAAAWEKCAFEVGVDSGQAGIFDSNHYRRDADAKGYKYTGEDGPIVPDEPWYSMCCDQTQTVNSAGVVPGGVVSCSGFGDGGYDAFVLKDKSGKIVAVRIVFIGADEVEDAED